MWSVDKAGMDGHDKESVSTFLYCFVHLPRCNVCAGEQIWERST